jgi:hypothetical protein
VEATCAKAGNSKRNLMLGGDHRGTPSQVLTTGYFLLGVYELPKILMHGRDGLYYIIFFLNMIF